MSGVSFRDDFDGPDLDTEVWLPHYLPAWCSRAETAASYRLGGLLAGPRPPGRPPVGVPGAPRPPLRVSGMMSGKCAAPSAARSGSSRSSSGQQVREEQGRFEGFLSTGGHLEVRCSMDITPRSMAALWLCGFEDVPEQCGEICVVEIFGNAVPANGSAEVGMGLKGIRDPGLAQDFAAPRLPIDPANPHTYAVDWDADEAVYIRRRRGGGTPQRRARRRTRCRSWSASSTSPTGRPGTTTTTCPELVVDHIAG